MAAAYWLTIAEMRVPALGLGIGIVMPDDFPLVTDIRIDGPFRRPYRKR